MGTINNILTGPGQTFLGGGTDEWLVSNTVNFHVSDTREQILFENLGSMKVVADVAGSVAIIGQEKAPGDQVGWESRGFVWAYATVPVVAHVSITVVENNQSSTELASVSLRPRKWTLLSVEGAVPTETSRLYISMQVDFSVAGTVYFTNPTIVTPNAISRNLFAAEAWLRLPQYLQEADANQEDPDYPLLRFLDVLTVELDALYTAWGDLRYIPPDDPDGPKTSSLDPAVSNIAVLRWWAQLLGVQFYDPSTGTTSWFNLETGVDEGGNDDGIPEWFEWETVPDGGDLDSVSSWDEIEQFNPSVSGLEESLRWQIQTAYFGLRGGTKEAILESAKRVLTGTKYANLVSARSLLNLPGTTGARVITTDKNSLDLTGDITLVVWAQTSDWTPAANRALFAKLPLSILTGYGAYVQPSGVLSFVIGTGSNTRVMASSAPGLVDGQGYWLEFFYDNTAKTCRFRKSSDPRFRDIDDIVWTTIGTSTAHAGGSPAANTDVATVGSLATSSFWTGTMGKVRLLNGTPTLGTVVASPDFTTVAGNPLTITDAQGNVWTREGASSYVDSDVQPEWIIRLQTKQSETPDTPGIGESSPSVEEVVANAIPAGFEFIHETIAG